MNGREISRSTSVKIRNHPGAQPNDYVKPTTQKTPQSWRLFTLVPMTLQINSTPRKLEK